MIPEIQRDNVHVTRKPTTDQPGPHHSQIRIISVNRLVETYLGWHVQACLCHLILNTIDVNTYVGLFSCAKAHLIISSLTFVHVFVINIFMRPCLVVFVLYMSEHFQSAYAHKIARRKLSAFYISQNVVVGRGSHANHKQLYVMFKLCYYFINVYRNVYGFFILS